MNAPMHRTGRRFVLSVCLLGLAYMVPAEEIDGDHAPIEPWEMAEIVEATEGGAVTEAEEDRINAGEAMAAEAAVEDAQSAAERALAEYADELRRMSQSRQAAADHHHSLGRRLMEEGRLPQAIEHLKIAVDFFPENQEYRRSLRDAETLAGSARDSRGTYIDQLADSLRVEHQRLWVEIEQHLDRGRRLLEEGSYNQAEQAFDMASTRLHHLPFEDSRRGPKMREVESLIQLTRERRSRQEVADAATSNRVSAERARQLREYELGLERERINMLLRRALKARERRDFDECIAICEQILKIRPNEARASTLLVTARRERHVYLRQVTADRWDEEHRRFSQDVRSSLLPQLDLIVYPDDWEGIDRRRRPPTRGVDGTEDEAWRQEIVRNLNQQLTLEFRDNDIQDVVNFLRANTDVNFVLDPEVLVGGGVPPINMQVSDIRLENALDFIMELTGLRYSLQNEAVYISTEAGLQGRTEMRIYDIRDLTMGLTQFPGPEIEIPEPGGQGSRLVPEITDDAPPDVGELMDIIQLVVAPDSWMDEGVGIDEYQGSMVISQTPEVHRSIEDLLTQLRRQRGVQINVKVRFLEIENSMLEEIGFNWSEYGGPIPVGGANPAVPQSGPPYAFGMYGRAGDGSQRAGAGTVNTPLIDYFSQARGYSRPTPASRSNPGDGDGLSMDLQIFRGEKGFLGSVLMQAVEKSRRGNVLIQPDVTLFSGQRAHIVRMNQQRYIADYSVVGSIYEPVMSVLSYGTVLDVHAVASADRRYITLTLRPSTAEIEVWRTYGRASPLLGGRTESVSEDGIAAAPDDDFFFGWFGRASNLPIYIPQINYQTVRTTVTIPDGGSLLVAGMNRSSSSRSFSGVPFLSHIPFLGRLFSSHGRTEQELKSFIYVEGTILLFEEIEDRL